MGEYLDSIPMAIQPHIREITKSSGLPETEESVEEIARAWVEKKRIFETELASLHMEEVDEFGADEERGAVVLTYSGSILTLGPVSDGVRKVEYTSIGLRRDVPDVAVNPKSRITEDLVLDEPASFTEGPIQKSSPVFKIAVASIELAPEDEEDLLSEATEVLTEEFVEVNKTIIVE